MDELVQLATRIFRAQPFTALLGAELSGVGADWAEITVTNREELRQQHGFVHGGVVSYLVDNSLTFAGGMALQGDAVTSGYTIDYLRPATGETLVARASAVSVSRRRAVCRCSVHAVTGGERVLVAVAQGTIAAVSATPAE